MFLMLLASQCLYSQVIPELRFGTGCNFYKKFSISKNNDAIQNVSYLFDVNVSGRIYYKTMFAEVGFVPKYNALSKGDFKSDYFSQEYSLGLGRKFKLYDVVFDLSLGYMHQVMNINTYILNSSNVLNSNNLSLDNGIGLLNVNKYSHGMFFKMSVKTINNLDVSMIYALDLSKNHWKSLNGQMTDDNKDYLNFLGVRLQYYLNFQPKICKLYNKGWILVTTKIQPLFSIL